MPPGMPMKIPIYYLPLWGSPYQILPDSLFINGPAQVGFDTVAFVNERPGWLKDYHGYVSDANRSGGEIVELVAHNYSISPRLLIALLEYQAGALSEPFLEDSKKDYPLGYRSWNRKGLFLQLAWAANQLNDGYYRFRGNRLVEIELQDGRLERVDPWQNAASISLHGYFNVLLEGEAYAAAISPEGLAATYRELFGDPWTAAPHLEGSLTQPAFLLPFEPGDVWALTGGPHAGWGSGEPLAALDFAPPSKTSGCVPSDRWATAVADGVVVRSEEGQVMLDLDGDGDERTGWNVFYLHVGSNGRVPLGAQLKQGERIGHPSCEGGSATGTHIHLARKYNGEWLPAEGWGGVLAFNLEGWTAHNGSQIYLGTLTRHSQVVTACTCSNAASWIHSDRISVRTPTPDDLATPNASQ
jgi:murein DD-endopeptidase MepM/ murein hydrolase activator NlpD